MAVASDGVFGASPHLSETLPETPVRVGGEMSTCLRWNESEGPLSSHLSATETLMTSVSKHSPVSADFLVTLKTA